MVWNPFSRKYRLWRAPDSEMKLQTLNIQGAVYLGCVAKINTNTYILRETAASFPQAPVTTRRPCLMLIRWYFEINFAQKSTLLYL